MALVVFTIFGQGRLHQWTYLVTDKAGYRYLLDERSVRQEEDAACTFLLKRENAQGSLQSRFRLNFRACTLQKGREEPQLIVPGTVAEDLRKEMLRRRGAHP